MKITRDRPRLLCGAAVVLAGAALLIADWDFVCAVVSSPGSPHVGWSVGWTLLVWGLALMVCGVGMLLEFKSDPPPRKDPWEA